MIKYLGNITTFEKMIKSLRDRGVDPHNNISDEYIIN